jgi:Amt family ammonium transporter
MSYNYTANITALQAQIDALSTKVATSAQQGEINELWHLVAGAMVFFMQAGFSMLEAGCVSSKNTVNILFKNIMDACISAVTFWLLGFGFAYGNSAGGFIGTSLFGLNDMAYTANSGAATSSLDFHTWFFQWAFAATAATIVSGSIAERTKLTAYFIYSIFITAFVYPVIVHWGWSSGGWLSPFASDASKKIFNGANSYGLIDFAGSGLVHMVGGFSGLVGAFMVGPRKGRFRADGSVIPKPGHSITLSLLGVLILWFGWYGFNCGSTLAFSGGANKLASKVAATTTIAPAFATLTAVIFQKIMTGKYDLPCAGNAALAGLVSITASCAVVEPVGAMGTGIIGAFVYIGSSKLLLKLKIDDPLDAAPIHGFCGLWGLLSCSIFGTDANAVFAGYDASGNKPIASAEQFGVQLVAGLAIMAWTVGMAFLIFGACKLIPQIGLTVDPEVEMVGLDISEHGTPAYLIDSVDMIKKEKEAESKEPEKTNAV